MHILIILSNIEHVQLAQKYKSEQLGRVHKNKIRLQLCNKMLYHTKAIHAVVYLSKSLLLQTLYLTACTLYPVMTSNELMYIDIYLHPSIFMIMF